MKLLIPVDGSPHSEAALRFVAARPFTRANDLLVMGSHGNGAVKVMVLGSVAAGVGARCSTPLLLVRPQ